MKPFSIEETGLFGIFFTGCSALILIILPSSVFIDLLLLLSSPWARKIAFT